ncbi:hypothetical protein K8O68_06460 [Salipaludibacillus sp. CUR1]|uniref:hypothetical protein n=1 Tax=Salipaludibacillus sp. CUR1 TaxID=2820003 RepID=UPI001E382C75|nr:hypothetical protein [Salipaludibacillus sp. CUR1]MCE7792063.1 hypothetical protein [Salipaludibacillus sp. CUR1]
MSEFNAKKKEDKTPSNHATYDEDVNLGGILNIAANLLKNTNADQLNNLSKISSYDSLNSLNSLLDGIKAVDHSNNESDNVNKMMTNMSSINNETHLIDKLSPVQNEENNDLKKLESKMDLILEELIDLKEQLDKVKVQVKKIKKKC